MDIVVKLDTFEKIKDYIQMAYLYPGDIVAKSGQYVVDGKSLMGLISLNLSNPIILIFNDCVTHDDLINFNKFLAQ